MTALGHPEASKCVQWSSLDDPKAPNVTSEGPRGSKRCPKGFQKSSQNESKTVPGHKYGTKKKTKSEIVLRLERERLLEGKIPFSPESQRNRESPFFSMFVRIVLRLQREHRLEGTNCNCNFAILAHADSSVYMLENEFKKETETR